MERAGRFLGSALRRLQRPEAGIAWLTSAWPEVVGKTLAAHTRPVRCQAGHLEVIADGLAWQEHLQAIEHEFCAQINCSWGGDLVRDIRFVGAHQVPESPAASSPASSARLPHEADNNHTPFIRRRHA
jgi:predicted nucleic acid-binding Zn ribbon protein